ATTCSYYAYWEAMDVTEARLFIRSGLFAVAVPCDGTTFLAIAWPRSSFAEVRQEIDGVYRQAAARVPWTPASTWRLWLECDSLT
ncbi:MAG TPA: hypothetical protein VGR08_00020, partial [Thermomicrobiales bacterium]|nr:hypothetical protein [Thermomicrobiales bacterium]